MDEQLCYALQLQEIASLANLPYELIWETAMQFYRQNQKGDARAAERFGVKMPAWHTEMERLYPDARPCLNKLHQHYSLGIIANQPPGTRERLHRHGILQFFDLIVASAEEGLSKPDRRIFETALQKSGCAPDQAVMIGDRIDNDILPARQLGIHTVWVRQGFWQYWKITNEAERPDYQVDNLAELCKLLL